MNSFFRGRRVAGIAFAAFYPASPDAALPPMPGAGRVRFGADRTAPASRARSRSLHGMSVREAARSFGVSLGPGDPVGHRSGLRAGAGLPADARGGDVAGDPAAALGGG